MFKTYTEALPASFYNLGSRAVSVKHFERDKLWRRMSPTMGRKAVEIPVFLVNEKQMDIIYPPQYQRALDPKYVRERLKDMLKDFRERLRAMPKDFRERLRDVPKDFGERLRGMPTINDLDRNDWEAYEKFVAVGLYVSSPSLPANPAVLKESDGHAVTSEAEEAYLNQEGPRIYICGERVVSWAESVGCSPDIVLDKVYYHELGHAIMDTYEGPPADNPYYTIWGRVIEECAANYIAYNCFSGIEARYVQKIISDQPAEYLGYTGLLQPQPFELPADSPGDWNLNEQVYFRVLFRAFFIGDSEIHPWYREMSRRLRRAWFYRDWDEFGGIVRHIRGRLGIPSSLGFWEWRPWTSDKFSRLALSAIASSNITSWTRYKAKGAPQDPEYVILLEEWALYLLMVGVGLA